MGLKNITKLSFSLLLAGLFVFQACSDSSTDSGSDMGSFNFTIEGDNSGSASGNAVFGGAEDPETDEQGFVVVMTEGDPEEEVNFDEEGRIMWLVTAGSSRPGEGTYNILDPDEDESELQDGFYGVIFFDSYFYVTESGQVEITNSSGDNVSGTFSVEATGFSFQNPQEEYNVTITGNFDAMGGDFFVPNNF